MQKESAVGQKAQVITAKLVSDPEVGRFVDTALPIPDVYHGGGQIKLIFLGQDPTVKNPTSRGKITMVLNLNRRGGLWNYLVKICKGLQLDLRQHVYATNYFKNFFVMPPTQITEVNVLERSSRLWLPFLLDELTPFAGAPVIALGQPLLSVLINKEVAPLVRDYWGYTSCWKSGEALPFRYLQPDENHLHRRVFPFPHQPSIRKEFYKQRMADYITFVGQTMGWI